MNKITLLFYSLLVKKILLQNKTNPRVRGFVKYYQLARISIRSLSAIIAMNSELVGLPLSNLIV